MLLTYITTFGIPFRSTWAGIKLLGWDIATSIEESPTSPGSFSLDSNYPNPFNPSTAIGFQLPVPSVVRFTIYNGLGQQVRSFGDRHLGAGGHQIHWDGRDDQGRLAGNGLYLVTMRADGALRRPAAGFVQTRKLMLLK